MEVAGIALVAIFFIIGVVLAPMMVKRRQALVESREGDRFSTEMRMVSKVENHNELRQNRSTVRLLSTQPEIEPAGAAMTQSRQDSKSKRSRRSPVVELDPQQAREMATLKAKRASRISRESAAGQRRLVTAVVALVAVVAVVVLAAFSVLSWWWCLVPGFFLGGSLVTSRLAGIRSENASADEARRFQILKEQIESTQSQPVHDRVFEESAAAASASLMRTGQISTVERADKMLARARKQDEREHDGVKTASVVEEPSVTEQTQSQESSELLSRETIKVAASGESEVAVAADEAASPEWQVAAFPVPASVRKGRVSSKQVHADTDIRGVPRVQKSTARPVEASGLGQQTVETDDASDTFTLNLDAVLDARRAQ